MGSVLLTNTDVSKEHAALVTAFHANFKNAIITFISLNLLTHTNSITQPLHYLKGTEFFPCGSAAQLEPYLLTYLLNPCSKVLEKLTASQLVKKFPAFTDPRFITAFTSARHLFLS